MPSCKEHKDGFNRDNIDSHVAREGFHILLEDITSERASHQNIVTEDTYFISLNLYRTKGRSIQETIDKALEKANCIRNKLLQEASNNPGALKDVRVTRMTPSPQETNDNAVIISMDIEIRTIYCIDCC